MNTELQLISERLVAASTPEAIFGAVKDNATHVVAVEYRRIAKITHPDKYADISDQETATSAFKLLNILFQEAKKRIRAGIYGDVSTPTPRPITISTRRRSFQLGDLFAQGDVCDIFRTTYNGQKGLFKVTRNPADNDLLANEAKAVKALMTGTDEAMRPYVPVLVDSFSFRDGSASINRHANVFENNDVLHSLKEVRQYFPAGLDARDMAWIWRRVLVGIGFAHANNIIHGAILPSHILIQPEQHGVVLVDWKYSVAPSERISAISSEYQAWYPPEVLAKEPVTPDIDIYMGAKCMVELMGGNPLTGELPTSVPRAIRAFFRGTILDAKWQRPDNAWALKDEFDNVIDELWPRKFRPLALPVRA